MSVVQAGEQRVDVERYLDEPGCLEQALAGVRSAGGHALCHCVEPSRRLVVRRVGTKHILAVWPDDGQQHAFSCAFYREPDEAGQTPESRPAPRTGPGDPDETLALAFNLERAPTAPRKRDADDLPAREQPGTGGRLDLAGLLSRLWARSRLNCWAPRWTRDWWRVRREIYRGIEETRVAEGFLNEVLYVPQPFRRDAAFGDAEGEWTQFVTDLGHRPDAVPRRLLLSEVKGLERASFGYKLDLRNVPWPVFVSREQWEHLQACYARALTGIARPSSPRVKLLALVLLEAAANGKHYFTMCDAAMLMTNEAWVPAHSTAELRLADYMIEQQRAFTRPMGADDAAPATPDFWLHDAGGDKPLAIEVLGVDAVPYRERKMRRAALLREAGHATWVWDATNDAPALPPTLRAADGGSRGRR